MDKATPDSAPANAEGVMAIAFELARIREEHGAQSGMYLSEVRALRAEVERLAAQAAPSEEMSPEFTDTARAALLWVLWHHQGGSSKVGQPIRFALGMGQHQPLSNYQVREAQRWEAMAPTRDAANVPPGEWNSEPEGLTPKQAWWAGYRVGKGLPPDMPRSEAVAAQPSQAPVVQAVQAREYPPLPVDALDALARMIKRGEPGSVPGSIVEVARLMHAYIDADRASRAPAVRMLTREELNDVALSDQVGWEPGEYIEAVQRKFCAVNAGRAIPPDGKIGCV